MGMYMYPIEVRREPQQVNYTDSIDLPDNLTLDILREYVKEGESFRIYEEGDGQFGSKAVLIVHRQRFETEEELTKRISKEERYMENYRKFHANKGK